MFFSARIHNSLIINSHDIFHQYNRDLKRVFLDYDNQTELKILIKII